MSEHRIPNQAILDALANLGVGAIAMRGPAEMSTPERLYSLGALNAAVDALMADEPDNTAFEHSEHLQRGYAHVVAGFSTGKDPYAVKGIERRAATGGWAMLAARLSVTADGVVALDELAVDDDSRIATATRVHAAIVLAAAFSHLGCSDAFLGGLTPEERLNTYDQIGSLLADVMGADVGADE